MPEGRLQNLTPFGQGRGGGQRKRNMVKIGVVGCGKIADRHLHAYRHIPGVEVAVTDTRTAVAAEMSSSFGVPHVPSLDRMLASDYDGIDVCVPTRYHFDIVMAALEAGKHVFCEKPLCLKVEEARAIATAGERAGVSVSVGYLYRCHPAFQFAKQIIDDGIIGLPYLATLRLGGRGGHATWKHAAGSGGGASHEMLVHMIDLALWLFGDFPRVEVHTVQTLLERRPIAGHVAEATAEDLILLSMVRDEMRATLEADLVTPSYMNHVEVQGQEGSLFTSILEYLPTVLFCKQSRDIYNQGNNFFTFPQTNLFELELAGFIQSIREGVASRESVEDAVRIQQVLDEIQESRSVRDRHIA